MTDQSKAQSDTDDGHTYDISTVCRLTGLTSANLRVWEKRYQAVVPTRSETGRRQYSRRDLQRLTLLKTLTELGHSISSSAKLPIAELERRIKESARPELSPVPEDAPGPERDQAHACRIGVVGAYIGTLLDNTEIMPGRAVKVAEFADLADAEQSETAGSITADLLVVECPALFPGEIPRIESLIEKTQALRAIVIYTYTQRDVLENIENNGSKITAIRAPISPSEFKVLCEADVALTNRSASNVIANAPALEKEGIPERKYSEVRLGEIAQLSSSVKCECPQQLASLLQSLNGFEIYSLECENRNAADAEIHAYLHEATAQARSIVEDALTVLLEFEGISPDHED